MMTVSAERESFNKVFLSLLSYLQQLGEPQFYLRHEQEIVDFLETFHNHSANPKYISLAEGLYFYLWNKRLKKFAYRKWQMLASNEEIIAALHMFEDFRSLLDHLPSFRRVIGDDWIIRHRAAELNLKAHLEGRWRRSRDAVHFFLQSAHTLKYLKLPSSKDLANAEQSLAYAAEYQGFSALRNRPTANLTRARREFLTGAAHARRGEKFLSHSVRNHSIYPDFRYYLRYWQHVAASQELVLQRKFYLSHKHLDLAKEYVSRLPKFPRQKWFTNIEDIDNQHIILYANKALIADDDLVSAQSHLEQWLARSTQNQFTGRYLRILLREKAIGLILEWEARAAMPIVRGRLADLLKLLRSRPIFGMSEMYIASTLSLLISGEIDSKEVRNRLSAVFILDTAPPPTWGGYIDTRSEVERHFIKLPTFLRDYLVSEDPADLVADEVLYAFLLYVRSVAEFWTSVYQKRVREERNTYEVAVQIPEDFATAGWSELAGCLESLSKAFESVNELDYLKKAIVNITDDLNRTGLDVYDETVLKDLSSRIVEVICKTERQTFPHIVLLERHKDAGQALVEIDLKNLWRIEPRYFNVVLKPRLGQEFRQGSYYFLKPSYKRVYRVHDEEDLVLFPLRPSQSFGEPSQERVAILVEGDDDSNLVQSALTRLNPYWRAKVTVVAAGGASKLRTRYMDLKPIYPIILVIGDEIGGKSSLDDLRRETPYVFTLRPDLEGVDVDLLHNSLRILIPDLPFTTPEIIAIIGRAINEQIATVKCLQEFQEKRDRKRHPMLYNIEYLKRKLAQVQSDFILRQGVPPQLNEPLRSALQIGFGIRGN